MIFHSVDHGNGCGRERNAGNLRRSPVPAHYPSRESERAQERQKETHEANRQRLAPVLANHAGLNLCTREEREQPAAKASQEINPGRAPQAQEIPNGNSDEDFDERNRNPGPGRDNGSSEGEPNPNSGDSIGVVHGQAPSLVLKRTSKRSHQPREGWFAS